MKTTKKNNDNEFSSSSSNIKLWSTSAREKIYRKIYSNLFIWVAFFSYVCLFSFAIVVFFIFCCCFSLCIFIDDARAFDILKTTNNSIAITLRNQKNMMEKKETIWLLLVVIFKLLSYLWRKYILNATRCMAIVCVCFLAIFTDNFFSLRISFVSSLFPFMNYRRSDRDFFLDRTKKKRFDPQNDSNMLFNMPSSQSV